MSNRQKFLLGFALSSVIVITGSALITLIIEDEKIIRRRHAALAKSIENKLDAVRNT